MKNIKGVKLIVTIAVLAISTSSCAFFGHKGGGHKNERHQYQLTQTQQNKLTE